MINLQRHPENPILKPDVEHEWESSAVFNGCVTRWKEEFYILYRAMSNNLSTIGFAKSADGVHFSQRRQILKPEHDWEKYGCEDPRITKFDDKFYIFYTALSGVPFTAQTIKVGLAISEDLQSISEKHLVTPFNAKAMSLFPKKIDGKIAAILTADTDIPPSKIAFALFETIEEIWSQEYWQKWYQEIDSHTIPIQRSRSDHVEAGAPPVETEYGWLLFHSYITNYFSPKRKFNIECTVLDLNDPTKIIGRIDEPILIPQTHYELYGNVPNIVFPSGALIVGEELYLYYGAADTTCCLATVKLQDLFSQFRKYNTHGINLTKARDNPVLKPKSDHFWEAKAVFNPAAFYESGKVHLVYRAMSPNNTSTLGYAASQDGYHIAERLFEPVYTPHEDFEHKKKPGNSGCEDPRITKIAETLYMCYTAFDSENPPRVALTSIDIKDFLRYRWAWERPILISPPGIDDKDACILPEKIKGKFVIFHRIIPDIVIDFVENLDFREDRWLKCEAYITPRNSYWDNDKIGICAPPIKTDKGWLMLYHGISNIDYKYRVGAMLLKLDDPSVVLSRSDLPILEPNEVYEKKGQVANVVFPCGNVVIGDELFVYYGAADSYVAVATIKLKELLDSLS